MDVVFVSVYLLDDNVGMMLRPGLEELLEICKHPFVEDLSSVFGRPHQVVVRIEYTVAHSSVDGHSFQYIRHSGNARTTRKPGGNYIPRPTGRGTAVGLEN